MGDDDIHIGNEARRETINEALLRVRAQHLRDALEYLRRKIDGYDVEFAVADDIARGAVGQASGVKP